MTVCPFAIMEPVANHSGVLSAHQGLVVHVQVGDGSCYGEFNNPASQASSTWQAMKDGTLLQFVDADYIAWTEAAGNPYYDSVETEGTPDEPLTPAQCATLARLIAWGHQTYGWPLALVDHGGHGVTTHAHYPSGVPDAAWGGHPCPGPVRAGQLPAIVAAAQLTVDPHKEPNVPQLAAPIIDIVYRPQNDGYWLIGEDGGLFAFGKAGQLPNPVVGKLSPGHYVRAAKASPSGLGLTMVASDGGVFCLGDAAYFGSLGGITPSSTPVEA